MDFIKTLKVSLGVAVITWLLSWVYGRFFKEGIANLTFSITPIDINVANQLKAGVDTSLAGKLIGSMIGAFPATLQTFLLLLLASFVVIWVGRFANKTIGDYGKTEAKKFAVDLTLGSVIVGFIVGWMSPSVGYLGTAIAMLIYFGIVALIYVWVKGTEFGKDLPTPTQ